jgi:hypothetical protein
MAVEFEVKGTRTSEYLFLPEQLDVDPAMNGRHDLPDIALDTKLDRDEVILCAKEYNRLRGR